MKRYGYHRTSTREQHLDRGIKEITAYCEQNNLELEKIFTDQQTGKNFNRPRYQVLKEDVSRAGDKLIITEVASIFINCLNFNTSFGKTERKNICLLAFLNILPPLLLAVAGYGYFFITGVNGFYGTNNQISDWMVAPLVPMLVTPFVTRAIYKKTRNPYLGGIINAVIITIMTCVNAQIVFPA